MQLAVPSRAMLPSYRAALQRGWSPDDLRPELAQEHLAQIEQDPGRFLRGRNDLQARGNPITLPDGSQVPRLPGFHRWMWTGEFCGDIGFRWQPGTPDLPAHVLGHIGYSVVPWQQHKGYATEALRQLLIELKPFGLPYVTLTTDPENLASQKVILANGGALAERFRKTEAYGGEESLRFKIAL